MLGIVAASLSCVSAAEKSRYQAAYCGLCRALKERYGQAARMALSYDLTFYVLLCQSLHEPPERHGEMHCPTHPLRLRAWEASCWTDRAADLAVALAYHKCLDDVHDEGGLRAHGGERLLRSAYATAQQRIPAACSAIEDAMADIRAIEQGAISSHGDAASTSIEASASDAGGDAGARRFGQLLGALFAEGQGAWAQPMLAFGAQLGRFIYLMDAAVDLEADRESGSYNPFIGTSLSPADLQVLLAALADPMAATFEKLPLVQDAHLLRSVLYSGIWQQFNRTYRDADLALAPIQRPSGCSGDQP